MTQPHHYTPSYEQPQDERVKKIICQCFSAYKNNNRADIEPLLADDLRFTSPYDDGISREEYFERCWPNAERIKDHLIEHLCVEGETAFVNYRLMLKDGSEFTNTEIMTVRGGQIHDIKVYFGECYKDGTFQKMGAPS